MEQIEENNVEIIEQTENKKMNELMKMMKEIKLKMLDIEKQIKKNSYRQIENKNQHNSKENNANKQKKFICYICEEQGHIAANCDRKRKSKRKERTNKCKACNQYGHFKRYCPNISSEERQKLTRNKNPTTCRSSIIIEDTYDQV
jgi:hypothetical protein